MASPHRRIKTLTKRFPEGPDRIAAALRDLETHGYLRHTRERTPRCRDCRRLHSGPATADRHPSG